MQQMENGGFIQQMVENHPRKYGAIPLLIGTVLAIFQIYLPLNAAKYGMQEIRVSGIMVAAAEFLLVYGIMLIILGKKANEVFSINPKKLSLKNIVIILALVGMGIATYGFIWTALENQGYR
jgi:uncharacterized membrane protein